MPGRLMCSISRPDLSRILTSRGKAFVGYVSQHWATHHSATIKSRLLASMSQGCSIWPQEPICLLVPSYLVQFDPWPKLHALSLLIYNRTTADHPRFVGYLGRTTLGDRTRLVFP